MEYKEGDFELLPESFRNILKYFGIGKDKVKYIGDRYKVSLNNFSPAFTNYDVTYFPETKKYYDGGTISPFSEVDPDEAWNKLQKRHNNREYVFDKHKDKLFGGDKLNPEEFKEHFYGPILDEYIGLVDNDTFKGFGDKYIQSKMKKAEREGHYDPEQMKFKDGLNTAKVRNDIKDKQFRKAFGDEKEIYFHYNKAYDERKEADKLFGLDNDKQTKK